MIIDEPETGFQQGFAGCNAALLVKLLLNP
jgi:hypothetical protein